MTGARRRAELALQDNFEGVFDSKGHVPTLKDNLLPGVHLNQFEDDLRNAAGSELDDKFYSVYSSSALAVNCFAPFNEGPGDLRIPGFGRASKIAFERKFPIFPEKRPPHLDVWIHGDGEFLAIESKLLEPLKKTKPKFSPSYKAMAPPKSEPCWWRAYEDAKRGVRQYLDRAQLIKHYWGLRTFREDNEGKKITFLYLFWEPQNRTEIEECDQHRKEVLEFEEAVSESEISFRWMTYNDLWEDWLKIAGLEVHTKNLINRYQVRI